MAKNDFGKLYVGITEDLKSRLGYHNAKHGAQFTKGKAKFHLVFDESYNTMNEARQREIQIKKWRRDKKEALIRRYSKELQTKVVARPEAARRAPRAVQ